MTTSHDRTESPADPFNWMMFPFNGADVQGWFERAGMMPRVMEYARKARKGATEYEIVFESGPVKLRRYRGSVEKRFATPLVCVFALVNRPYVLDLLPRKSVVRQFLDRGFDVYLIDWGEPTPADHDRTLHDYIEGHLHRIVQYLLESCEVDQVSLLGYCMGGTMSAMYTALYPKRVRNLMLLAAGIDFSSREGLLSAWSDPAVFDVDGFVDAYGNCPAEFLQGAFLMLKPVANFVQKPLALFERLGDEAFVDEYITMETWLSDNVAVPGEVYREFVKYLYQQNLLVKNRMVVGRRVVDLKKITCPVLNLMATRDDLVPCAQSEAFNDLVGSTDRRTIKFPAGHIGLAVGSKAQKELWPEVTRWLAER